MEELHYNLPDQEMAFEGVLPPKRDDDSDNFMDLMSSRLTRLNFDMRVFKVAENIPSDSSTQRKHSGGKIF